jgi:hypothetical protein
MHRIQPPSVMEIKKRDKENKSMKLLIATIAAACFLTGCGQTRNGETERKLAEAQQKLEEANRALQQAQQSIVSGSAKTQQQQEQTQAPALAAPEPAEPPPAPKPEPPRTFTVPAGTAISIRTHSTLSSKTSKDGSAFEASLTQPLTVNGHVVAGKGALVDGIVIAADEGGRVKGKASLALGLKRLETIDAGKVNIRTAQVVKEAKSGKKKDAAKVGIATGIGAAIGAIAGGGKGAAIGAGAGAAGGTGLVLATKGTAAEIPAESVLTFRLVAPITVQESR